MIQVDIFNCSLKRNKQFLIAFFIFDWFTLDIAHSIQNFIYFSFQDYNKVHINVLKCPRLLADKIMNVFPALNIRKENLKLIKLSYNKYTDQNRGQLDVINSFLIQFFTTFFTLLKVDLTKNSLFSVSHCS